MAKVATRILSDQKVPLQVKGKNYKTIIRSTIIYESEEALNKKK